MSKGKRDRKAAHYGEMGSNPLRKANGKKRGMKGSHKKRRKAQ
jgi:hypothetical protein